VIISEHVITKNHSHARHHSYVILFCNENCEIILQNSIGEWATKLFC